MSEIIRVLHFTTHDEDCGIAKYQQWFIDDLSKTNDIYSEIFEYSPNKTKHMPAEEFAQVLQILKQKLTDFDILHIQHELSFFKHSELQLIVDMALAMNKKVMVTVHTAPDAQYQPARLAGFGPRSFVRHARTKRFGATFIKRYVEPLTKVDLVIVHNQPTKQSLMNYGVQESRIVVIPIPVPKISFSIQSNRIHQALSYKKDDIIFCTVGFISRSKGIIQAVKALSFLPENYKLAIIGGVHPDSEDDSFLDEVADHAVQLGVRNRIYITGYIKEDDELNSLIRECDICVYPYDKKYYSYVSSASLNNAFANHKPAIAYPIKSFMELNNEGQVVNFCKSANYYELAREVQNIDIDQTTKLSTGYAKRHSYDKEAASFADIYQQLISK